ncbi:cation:proton antiporter [Jatrophihabitans sp.]|uniref:cation:proton antiporter domain-containing protein n=1 Tax=Jatrophihabitans sp. TaxID=1932789 RepID=UPI002CAA811C|nr:cation:proton antiporter [Jatrophihabitans sp.]
MPTHQIQALFLGLAAILVLARVLGWLAARLGQPPVIGEIIAGIAMGPTLFGGQIASTLFPTEIRPLLAALANVGLALFMFIVGCELEHATVVERKLMPISVSVGSTVLPFLLGSGLGLYLYTDHQHGSRLGFVLFFAASMSVTAFPVLARILSDRGMTQTRLGAVALASAAISDVLAWGLLAVAVTVSGGGSGQWRTLLLPVFVVIMFTVIRPLLAWLVTACSNRGTPPAELLVPVVVGLLLSSWAAEWMGVHLIFGAFLFGAVMPRDGLHGARRQIVARIEPVTTLVLLPIFFIVAGFKVDLSDLGAAAWGELVLIMLVAILGKTVGAYLGARVQGAGNRDAAVLATLMNTRGLTELVILSVGLQLGFLDGQLYSLMVVMAVITTTMAGPLLAWLYPRRQVEQDAAEFAATASPS